jgi:ABC-2 type transport system permease protein
MAMLSKVKNNISDTMVMTGRVLNYTLRSVDTIITVVAMPVLMMLMFVYVFGGSMNTGSIKYVNYVVPGIVLMCILSGIAYTAVRLNNDVTKGIFERFH